MYWRGEAENGIEVGTGRRRTRARHPSSLPAVKGRRRLFAATYVQPPVVRGGDVVEMLAVSGWRAVRYPAIAGPGVYNPRRRVDCGLSPELKVRAREGDGKADADDGLQVPSISVGYERASSRRLGSRLPCRC